MLQNIGDPKTNRFGGWLRRLFASEEEIENLRDQFYVTLRAYLARVEAKSPAPSAALDTVRQLLGPGRPPRWSDCYEVEQLLVHLFDDAMLRTELEVRLLEAETNLRSNLYDYYRSAARDPADVERRRTLLSRLVNDLQWRYTVQEGKRRFSKSLTTRTGIAFLIALAGFAWLAAFVYTTDAGFAPGDLRLLCAAGVAGTLGATFSMLTGLQTRIEASAIYDLNMMRAITMLMARALVGAGAACVIYLFFSSGFLSGSAFPDLSGTNDLKDCGLGKGACLKSSTVSLLVIWCFIAGFSEKLVPGLLAKAEGKADASPPAKDHYRPIEPPPVSIQNSKPAAPAPGPVPVPVPVVPTSP
jgi:hypothetical protein